MSERNQPESRLPTDPSTEKETVRSEKMQASEKQGIPGGEKRLASRRTFVKLSLVGSVGAAAVACGPASDKAIPLLLPEEQLPPGVAFWSRGVCRMCGGGCGTLVKRMDALVPVRRAGQDFQQHRLVAKKIEGNPDHPINRGALCARGQAGLEATYHHERLQHPLALTGARGSGDYRALSWSEAVASLAAKLGSSGGKVAWVGRPLRGTEASVVGAWLGHVGATRYDYDAFHSPLAENSPDALLPELIGDADFVLSFGNFLELWPNQVAAMRAFARFRKSRRHGTIVHIEPRLSLTGTSADAWLAVAPGTEGVLARALAAALRTAPPPSSDTDSQLSAQPAPHPAIVEAARDCNIESDELQRVLAELEQAERVVVLGGKNLYAYGNGESNALALADLREALGSRHVALPAPAPARYSPAGRPFGPPFGPPPNVLIVHEVNPLFSAPPAWHVDAWLRSIPFIVALNTFADETALQANLVLPLSTTLESWTDDETNTADGRVVYSLNEPAMTPLHDTRSIVELALMASKAGGVTTPPLDAASAEDAVKATWDQIQLRLAPGAAFKDFWAAAVARGGYWTSTTERRNEHLAARTTAPGEAPHRAPASHEPSPAHAGGASTGVAAAAAFAGDESDYPFFLRFYESPVFGDGRWAHLTWLQELPDPTTSAMWSNWVELHPVTAERMGLRTGDGVWVESPAGRIELPVFVYPGIRPDTVAIPSGQGHSSALVGVSNVGSNPYSLLVASADTAAVAWEGTRVRLSPSGSRPRLALFGRSLQHEKRSHSG
jgi:anaerobic selenocysteine-containing dehydrogenase